MDQCRWAHIPCGGSDTPSPPITTNVEQQSSVTRGKSQLRDGIFGQFTAQMPVCDPIGSSHQVGHDRIERVDLTFKSLQKLGSLVLRNAQCPDMIIARRVPSVIPGFSNRRVSKFHSLSDIIQQQNWNALHDGVPMATPASEGGPSLGQGLAVPRQTSSSRRRELIGNVANYEIGNLEL
jgi:hypothetical protein